MNSENNSPQYDEIKEPEKNTSMDQNSETNELSEAHEEAVEPEGSNEGDEVSHDEDHYRGLFEAALFLSNEPLPVSFFVKNFSIDPTQAKILIDTLIDEYEERDGGVRLVEISNGYQFVTNPIYSEQIRRSMGLRKRESLSKGMLETLSIIAYKQPIVLAEVDELRGVSSRMMVANLMKRNLVKPVGRKELPGRPLAYGTTDDFLQYFGLNKLSDLPKLSEIKEFSLDSEE